MSFGVTRHMESSKSYYLDFFILKEPNLTTFKRPSASSDTETGLHLFLLYIYT